MDIIHGVVILKPQHFIPVALPPSHKQHQQSREPPGEVEIQSVIPAATRQRLAPVELDLCRHATREEVDSLEERGAGGEATLDHGGHGGGAEEEEFVEGVARASIGDWKTKTKTRKYTHTYIYSYEEEEFVEGVAGASVGD